MRSSHSVAVALVALAAATLAHDFIAQSSAGKPLWAESSTDVSGAVSRDGRLMTYIDWSSGELGLRDLTSGTNRLLTKAADWSKSTYAGRSVFSRDGARVRAELRYYVIASVDDRYVPMEP